MDFKSCFSHFEARLWRCWKTVSSLAACMQIASGAQPGSSLLLLLLLGIILVSILNRRKVEGIRLFIEITVKFFWD